MKSAAQFTRDTIAAIKVSAPAITVSELSTTTNIYKLIRPVAEPVEMVGADVEKALFSQSFLAASGKYLDNLIQEINVQRLEDESDSSVKANAGGIFVPGFSVSTSIDPDEKIHADQQMDTVKVKTVDQLYTLAKSKFFRLMGATDLPMIAARYWAATAFILAEQYQYIQALLMDDIIEDSDDIADTDWLYTFDALRVPGVRHAKVELSDYNEITIYVDIDERPGVDYRNRKLEFHESKILVDAHDLGVNHLPKPDHIVLTPPTLIVRRANDYSVPVQGIAYGTASFTDVISAIDAYFYDNRDIGVALSNVGIVQAVNAISGITASSFSLPSDDMLKPPQFSVLKPGYMEVSIL